jgi:5-methyltetrahydropteroyltriglutamate--homocysteine methyltransferase
MLQWSFVRDDQPRRLTAFQLALAIREEVVALEKQASKLSRLTNQPYVKVYH